MTFIGQSMHTSFQYFNAGREHATSQKGFHLYVIKIVYLRNQNIHELIHLGKNNRDPTNVGQLLITEWYFIRRARQRLCWGHQRVSGSSQESDYLGLVRRPI